MEDPNEADDTTNFILDGQARLQRILQRLNWSLEGVLRNFNTNSIASSPKAKILPRESVFPPSCSTNNYCVLATPELHKLLKDDSLTAPNNFHELQANFTREQKLQIYEHVIQNTKKLENNVVDEPAGEKSLADIVAENKREAYRKKRKFRISKPTRIEEVRAMVGLQMQSLQQFIENQKKFNCRQSISSFKDKQSHSKDESSAFERSKKADNKSCNYRRQEICKEHNCHRPKKAIERLTSTTERESSSKTHRNTDAFDFKTTDKKYYECSRKRSLTNSNCSRRKHRSRSKSPDSRNSKSYRTSDREGKDLKSHIKKRSKSREYNQHQRGRERTKSEKSNKTAEDKRSKDRQQERRSGSKEKHRHHKKKQKKSRSRSKTRAYHSRDDNKRKK